MYMFNLDLMLNVVPDINIMKNDFNASHTPDSMVR